MSTTRPRRSLSFSGCEFIQSPAASSGAVEESEPLCAVMLRKGLSSRLVKPVTATDAPTILETSLPGVFAVVDDELSVILQVAYFKYTKRKYGEGRRIFLMSPLHHHYQKKNIHESKIVTRFWIVGILLAILTLATLKLQ